jgi:2-methylcitrate dehydratase PrpD
MHRKRENRLKTQIAHKTQTAPWIQRLARFVARTPPAAIPANVHALGRRILSDCIACIVAGNGTPELRRLLEANSDTGDALVLGSSKRRDVVTAAFLNGTAGTWHDLDEGNLHTKGHAGIQIVPAALAEAERLNRSGAELVTALILAYEASCRIYRACTIRLAVHPHGTYGPLAAALAIGRLRRLDESALAQTLNLAAALALPASRGTLRDGATVRNVYTGMSGRSAFLAHQLRETGFSGETDAVGSIFGEILGEAFDPKAAVADLGRVWWIRRNYFKRFASGRYIHSALDLVETIATRRGKLAAKSIRRIDVVTYFMAATMKQQSAQTAFGTRFSIPLAVASLIRHGRHDLLADGTADLADPAIRQLARRVFVTESKPFTRAYPDRQQTRVTITFIDGSIERAEADFIRGEAENPLSAEELAAKFTALTAPSWGEHGSRSAAAALAEIERVARMRTLTDAWQNYALREKRKSS